MQLLCKNASKTAVCPLYPHLGSIYLINVVGMCLTWKRFRKHKAERKYDIQTHIDTHLHSLAIFHYCGVINMQNTIPEKFNF